MAHQQQQQQQQQQAQQYHPQNQDQGNPFFNYQPAFFVQETNLDTPGRTHPGTVRNYYKLLGLDYGQQADENVIKRKILALEEQIYTTARENIKFLDETRMELLDPVRRQNHYLIATQVGTYDVMLRDVPRIKEFHDSNSRDAYQEYNRNREKGMHYHGQERSRYVQKIKEEHERALFELESACREREWVLCAGKEAAEQALRDEKARVDKAKESADLDVKRQTVDAVLWAIERVKEASAAHYRTEQVEAKTREAMGMAKARDDPLFPVRDAEYLAAVAVRKAAANSQAVLEKILSGILSTADDLGIDGQEIKNAISLATAMEFKKMEEERLEEARVNREAEERTRVAREQQEAREKTEEMARVAREQQEAREKTEEMTRTTRECRDQVLAREQQDSRKKSAQRERRERRKQKPADTRCASPVNQTNKVTKSKSKSRPLSRRARKLAEALLEALAPNKRSSRGAVKVEEEGEEEEEEEEGSSGISSGGGQSPVSVKVESP